MNHCTKEQLIAFETRIKDLWEAGELPFLIHLSGGNEDELIRIFEDAKPGDWFFSSHRNHYHYLLAGGSPERLEKLIREGNSMFVFDKSINFLSSSVLAGTCCPAVGVAWELKRQVSPNHVWCFLGDGAEESGHFYEAVMFAHGHDLPVTFIIEDNNRSVDTDKENRRGPWIQIENSIIDMAQRYSGEFGIGMPCVRRYEYTPTYPHAGSGCKTKITFNPEAIARYLANQNSKN